ncbi:hypothetical protein C5748_18365 [Phyllobacterium phragmitis]|uniref:Uncharacterized protein n=1 Tax=Phyllobacterium phragmitis TaxID=2670329 RepID=A0A2S9INL1_9HYPH|nr:hypothetical protein [Phyllobacterium phragmitis]PRD42114.1 hypothetical protein C5748_18365 [Phyllobacterium phragmitis]
MRNETIHVKPWSKDQGEYVIINKADFDPKRHELFEEAAPVSVPASTSDFVDGEAFSDDQLRDIITKASGAAPHHRTGRDKLIEQFNELQAKSE